MPRPSDERAMVRGWVMSAHPGPTVAVTAIVTTLGWAIGWAGSALFLLAGAVLLGQLSVGWSNDAHDAADDARAHRFAKPTVQGIVTPRALWIAAATAASASAVLSVAAAGWIGAAWHVLAIGMAWAYNVRLSRTWLSWLPYAIAFGAVAPFLTFGRDGSWPPAWLPLVLALVGVAAHFTNALRDFAVDQQADLSGAVVLLGPTRTRRFVVGLLTVASVILAMALVSRHGLLAAAPLAALALTLAAMRATARPEVMFRWIVTLALADVAFLATTLRLGS
jgi:4-hydroxybenzoate polyprenyltransferase